MASTVGLERGLNFAVVGWEAADGVCELGVHVVVGELRERVVPARLVGRPRGVEQVVRGRVALEHRLRGGVRVLVAGYVKRHEAFLHLAVWRFGLLQKNQ